MERTAVLCRIASILGESDLTLSRASMAELHRVSLRDTTRKPRTVS